MERPASRGSRSKPKPPTFEEHEEIGQRIAALEEEIFSLGSELARHYGKTSDVCRRLWTVGRKINTVRYLMEDHLTRDIAKRQTRYDRGDGLAHDARDNVYSGNGKGIWFAR